MHFFKTMSQRNSLNAITDLNDLSHLDEIVIDKRFTQRASSKKNRRNRHYEKQFIRHSLAHHLEANKNEAINFLKMDEIDL